MTERTGVADRLYGLLVRIFSVSPPLAIVGWDGSRAGASEGPVLRVRSRKAIRRLLWSPGELGLARAYVAGELDIDGDLTEAMRQLAEFGALARAKESFDAVDRREVLRTAVLLGAVGPPPRAPFEEFVPGRDQSTEGRAVVGMTHDAELIRSLLGESLTYSCAWWAEASTLDEAQYAKLDRVCRSLELRPGARLLDIGCGWGGLLLHAARHHDVRGVGVVRSAERADVVRAEVSAAGLDDRIEVRLGGPVDIDDGPYDAIADIESQDQSPEYAPAVRQLLGSGGRLLQQQMALARAVPDDAASFMRSYVHPATPLIPLSQTLGAWEDAGLELRSVHSMREDYPPTFHAWAENLDREWERVRAAVGEQQARVWRLSLALASVGFERGRVSVYQALAVRPQAHGGSGLLS
ncbi:class I SAM-dependent methyltransferase [Solicola gregarius]|uniref:Class I SAM-dependent methyltransferase n=1 Tax=Solicola gregarius TaxID=2908642 RepID=A0AA46TJK2_9ACTN|nr:class I SAM-dependent methyltransferase [Solicola gregarius]UYM06496.1 class I SAM-dependent methyltransferase [Solicola gregarius]